ncbi:MAG TPA: phosphatase PAP2 family protein [Xanthobacteraceae bacterium]|nr:phosphatase PAP2 family protein [Xanthobacteraceae bacterium]
MSLSVGKAIDVPMLRGVGVNLAAWVALLGRPRRFKASRVLPPWRRLAFGGLAGIALVALAMQFLDARSLTFVRTLPPGLVDTFNEITDFGRSSWFLVPLAILIVLAAALATPAAGRIGSLVLASLAVRFGYLFFAIAVPGLFVTIVKRLIGRVRPSDVGPFAYMPWSWRNEYASLPSGHSTTAFAAAVAIAALWPKARIPMLIFAAIIALSRVIITAHFVSDVVAAAFVGGFGAILVRNWYASRGLAFVPEFDGSVRAKPGPSWRRIKSVAARLVGR